VRRRCFVCGFRSAKPVRPRCNTILRPEQAVCCMCGKAFDGWIAACDACGAPMKVEPVTSEERHAFRSLASVPGNSKDRAKVLAVKGFDVDHVEHLLEDDLSNLRERSARLICLQVAKKVDSGRYRCPLCEVRLESTAEECANYGARFS